MLAAYEDAALEGERFSAVVARLGTEAFFPIVAQVLDGTHAAPVLQARRVIDVGNDTKGARKESFA